MSDRTPNVPGEDLSQQAERDRQMRAARLARLKQDLHDRPREMKRRMASQPRLRLQIAENLWKIVEDARSRSPAVTRAAVLHATRMGKEYESTKRSEYYFCDPMLPADLKANRATKLTRTLRGYVELAKTTADLLDLEDHDTFLLDLFSGTSFTAEIESDVPPEDPQREAWGTLQDWLQQQARKISEQFDLRRYFARQTGWSLRYRDGKFEPGDREAEEPSAFLGWADGGYPRRGLFSFRAVDPREAYGSDCTPDDVTNYEDLVRRNAYELPVDVHTVVLLHLVLAPQGGVGTVVPCLRARCISYITAAEHWNALEAYAGKPLQRGDIIAVCHRAIASRSERLTKPLPESLTAGLPKVRRAQPLPEREFEIGEHELVYRDMKSTGYGFDMGDVVLRDDLPTIPPSLVSADPFDRPRIMLPVGDEVLGVLGLQVSSYMAERIWAEANSSQLGAARPEILTAVTQPLVEDWLAQNEDGRARIEAIAANPTPFRAGTMLAALDRACQSSSYESTPISELRSSARELTAALDAAISALEALRDANLRESLGACD